VVLVRFSGGQWATTESIQIENNLKIELPPQRDDLNVSNIALMCRGRKYWHARAKPYTNTISAKAQKNEAAENPNSVDPPCHKRLP
jgi:hypothetical protein